MTFKKFMILLLIFSIAVLNGCGKTEAVETRKSVAAEKETEMTDEEKKDALLEERNLLEIKRKETYGKFYVPLPPVGKERELKPVTAKALYVSNFVAGYSFNEAKVQTYGEYIKYITGQSTKVVSASSISGLNKLEKILGICEATEVNALVIDIKNDDGLVSWESDIPIVNEIKSNWKITVPEYQKLLDYLNKHEIYPIARIVAFKDPYLAKKSPEHAIQLKAGGVYKDNRGTAWVNPFDKYIWDYDVAIAKEAALRGFKEIQFDYVRFPDNAKKYNPITEFPGRNGRDKDEGIEDFLAYAKKELKDYNVYLAADVFGVITRSWDDKPEDIGQTWRKIASKADYICPMIYPSHYGPNWYGYPVPDREPYGVLRGALKEALERNAAEKEPGKIRPWIQGFTAPWIAGHIEYTPEVISKQIVAGVELGIEDYIIWDAANSYDPKIFFYKDKIGKIGAAEGKDILGRTPADTLKKFLDAEKYKIYYQQYLLTPIANRAGDYDEFAASIETQGMKLISYKINGVAKQKDGTYIAKVSYEYKAAAGTATSSEAEYKIIKENDVFKIVKPKITYTKDGAATNSTATKSNNGSGAGEKEE